MSGPGGRSVGRAPGRELTLDDIADLRAYEREREEFRVRVKELKRRRRVSVGSRSECGPRSSVVWAVV